VEWPIALRTLAGKMRNFPFTSDSNEGFLLDRVRDNSIEGRFIEKLSVTERLLDPFGNESVFDRVSYRQLEFNMRPTFPQMEFWNAPRSTQAFLSRLTEFGNFSVMVAPLSLNLLKWVDGLQSQVNTEARIQLLQLTDLELQTGVHASVVVKGDRDVRDAVRLVTKNRRYTIDKVEVMFTQGDNPVSVQLGRIGTAKIDESVTDELLFALRNSVPSEEAQE
jgi:hypothetical protein